MQTETTKSKVKTATSAAKTPVKYYAIVKKNDGDQNQIIEAQTRSELKKGLSDPTITDVEHVFRGRKMEFKTSTAINFS